MLVAVFAVEAAVVFVVFIVVFAAGGIYAQDRNIMGAEDSMQLSGVFTILRQSCFPSEWQAPQLVQSKLQDMGVIGFVIVEVVVEVDEELSPTITIPEVWAKMESA